MAPLALPLLSTLATALASLLLVRKAPAWGLVDLPGERKVHDQPTPRTGGLAMVLGGTAAFVIAWALGWISWPSLPWQTWLAGLGFITVGAADDRFSFQPRQKIFVLLALSALAAWPWVLVLRTTGVPIVPAAWSGSPWLLFPAGLVLTLWFMAVPNAVNIEDAINGYMGGFTFLVLIGLAVLGMDTRIAMGCLVGFLVFNWPKAKHFLGDAGSFGCGFFLAEALLRGGGLMNPEIALACTAPISMDVAIGLIRRQRLGMSFFSADQYTCPHHVLKRMGGNPLFAAPVLWFNAAGFVFLANHPRLVLMQSALFGLFLLFINRKPLGLASRYNR